MKLLFAALFSIFLAAGAGHADGPKRIAVLEFELAKGVRIDRIYFSDMARGAVKKAAPQLFVMTRESTESLLEVNGKTTTDCLGECEVEIGRKLGADYIVSGRITQIGTRHVLTMRLFAMADGALLGAEEATGRSTDRLFDLSKDAVARLIRPLADRAPMPKKVEPAASAQPPSPTARVRSEPQSGLEFIYIEKGNFHMGCEARDTLCDRDERPGVNLAVDSFWLGKTDVTVAAYAACVDAKACRAPAKGVLCNRSEKAQHPINCVGWKQAQAFCKWIGGRLPTVEEWEFAAKGGGSRIYPWGDLPPTAQFARFNSRTGTAPVGSTPAGKSKDGLLDMAGNVWQWTASSYDSNSIELRGGAWNVSAASLRSSFRYRYPRIAQNFDIGFRCAQ